MKIKNEIKANSLKLICIALVSCLFVACNDTDIDNTYSRHELAMELTPSTDAVALNEGAPNDVALTLNWSPAIDYGGEFVMEYRLQMDLVGSKAETVIEYTDFDQFERSYTNKELHDILINKFQQLTSTNGEVKFTISVSYAGPYTILPDVASASVKVKTYGDKQFLADKLFMSGTAVGENDVELTASAGNSSIYVYNGPLKVGTINFPALYGDEENAFCPESDTDIASEAMPAVVVDRKLAKSWNVTEADNYRVTVNLANKTVTIIASGDIIEVDKIYLAGTAVTGEDVEVVQTLEDDNLYAFMGELKAGTLYLPIMFNESKAVSIVPTGASHDIDNGTEVPFAQAATASAAGSRYWEIPADGTYRIVVNTDAKTIGIYYGDKDLTAKIVGPWNGAAAGLGNPYTGPIENLWMYGGFNAHRKDSGSEFESKYCLVPSVANPRVFVYLCPDGETLPRETVADEYDKAKSVTGAVRFCVSNGSNNAYAFGSTADAKRNSYCGYVSPVLDVPEPSVEGQSDNRYAYFLIPEKANLVIVDVDKLTVTFKAK